MNICGGKNRQWRSKKNREGWREGDRQTLREENTRKRRWGKKGRPKRQKLTEKKWGSDEGVLESGNKKGKKTEKKRNKMREDRKGGIEKRGLKTKSWKKRDGKKGGLNGKGLKEER